MPNAQVDHLFQLVKSLTKAEKRNFKLYAKRNQSTANLKFVQLFDAIDKQSIYNEELILKKVPDIKRQQLSNLKRHLYKQILTSLRLLNINKNIAIEIREQLDFIQILYNKGLYLHSLRLLDRVKSIAKEAHQDHLHLEVLEFEKMIESRHITRSIENRAEELAQQSELRQDVISSTTLLTNLGLQLYGLYIKIGHVKNEKDAFFVHEFYKANVPKIDLDKATFFEKVYFYQSKVWYHFILQDFPLCYKNAQLWLDMFKAYPEMKEKDTALFLRAYNNILTALMHLGYFSKFALYLDEIETYTDSNFDNFTINLKVLSFQYIYTARLNKHFLEGTFTDGTKWVSKLENHLEEYKNHLDAHRVMVFYYKIASLYFGSGDNDTAIDYLNKIIHSKVIDLREDIQCYARMLHLIAHYELKHYQLLEYLVKSVYRFLIKMEDLNDVQKEVLRFLRKAVSRTPDKLNDLFIKLKNRLESLSEDPFERRSFLYLDIISWLDSKIRRIPVQTVIQEKFKRIQR